MKKVYLLLHIMLFCMFSSFAQNQSSNALNIPVQDPQLTDPSVDIQLAGLYMEKAAKHYKISKILYVSAIVVPMIFRLTEVRDGNEQYVPVTLIGGSLGLVGLGFSFSGDSKLKKGSGILRRINLK